MMTSFILLQSGGINWASNVMLLGMLLIMVVFIILPQQRAKQKHKKYIDGLKKGDEVVTSSGIHGRIISIAGTTIDLEVDRGVTIKLDKASLSHDPASPERK